MNLRNLIKDTLKLCVSYIGRFLLHAFYIFPIKKNRIIFISMAAKQYSCNPRYISEYFQEKEPQKYELIWVFNKPEQFSYLKSNGIKTVRYRSLQYYYYKLTSKVSITNYYWGPELPSRMEQFEIQTWHGGGGGTKKASGDDKSLEDNKVHYIRYMLDTKRYSLMMASSRMSLQNTIRGAMRFTGATLPGTPRNDLFFDKSRDDIRNKVRSYFGINANEHIAIYAPTWRSSRREKEVYDLDYARTRKNLESRFGGKWKIICRLHPQANNEYLNSLTEAINATDYPDMQELLYTVDLAITDYSSFVWDFSFTYKPCFLYCRDLEQYIEERDFYTPIETWGFDVCTDNDELEKAILSFDQNKYVERLKNRQAFCGSFEDGYATNRVTRVIGAVCYGDGKIPKDIKLV